MVAVARNFDLAVLKIDKTGLTPVTMGDSDQVKVGETVVAIGNPLGLKQTVSVGVVSAVHRNMGFSDFDDLIQTDAASSQPIGSAPNFGTECTARTWRVKRDRQSFDEDNNSTS